MKNKTVIMAAVLAVATVLTAGLALLPSSVQEAQANPCATEQELDFESEGDLTASSSITSQVDQRECTFIGNIDID
jgi:hypothetical protein